MNLYYNNYKKEIIIQPIHMFLLNNISFLYYFYIIIQFSFEEGNMSLH